MDLQCPELPCAIERRPWHGKGESSGSEGQQPKYVDSYYPLEVLKILPGQRVPIQKQTRALTQQMIQKCQSKVLYIKSYMCKGVSD